MDESKSEFQGKKIQSEKDVYRLLKEIESFSKEHFIGLYLDSSNKVIAIDTITIGTLNASLIHPRELFRPAILHNSAAVVNAHNHPSGSCEPSDEDIKITEELVSAGDVLGIKLLDHVIIAKDGYKSIIDLNTDLKS